ncbi:MAG: hypothetical protein R2932_52725 [Caldilineaceae bacterium]
MTSLSTSSLASSLGTSQLLIDFARAEIQGTTIVSHEYENFTMRATFRVSDTGNVLPLIPIMSYIPHTTTTGTPITFSVAIKNIEDNMKGITASLPCTNPMTTPFSPIDEMADWWYDVRYDPRENLPSSLNFVAYGENSGYFRCQIDQNASPALPISFSISESTLYIGFDPIMDAYFTGTMESVLIDPTDSKPPD